MIRIRARWIVPALLVAVPACSSGGDAPESGPAGEDSADAAAPSGAPAATGDEGTRSRGDTVEVLMDEYYFDAPDTVPGGSVAFEVRNGGFEEHNFEIHLEDSILHSFDQPLNPAQTRVLEVELEPGTYDLLCTVSGHEGRGMRQVLTVADGGGEP